MSGGTILESLAGKAKPLVQSTTEKWTGKLADQIATRLVPGLPSELQGSASDLIAKLREDAPLIGGATVYGFAAMTSHLALGEEDQARLVWLSTAATIDDEMSELDSAFVATRTDAAAKAQAWNNVRQVALDFLEIAETKALPILLSMALAAA